MCKEEKQQATSTELTGGTGFTYEDTVVAYYFAALLREERVAGLNGIVKTVAVQQAGHGYPMDDIIIELDNDGSQRRLNLQVKRKIQISASATNNDFRDILSRDLTNRATKGWHQVQLLNSGSMGTPIPVVLEFPWGKQEFWGDWHVYNWFMGQLAPNPLNCAFLALSYWAFKQIEGGRPTDEVIQAVVKGNKCYAALGLALVLAFETFDVSETTLPVVTCQRLWSHDIARFSQEPMRNIDLLGFGLLSRLTGDKAKAKEFLDSRQSRKREIRDLVMRFALTTDDSLRQRFKEVLARFPDDLPYEVEEQLSISGATASLKEAAERWAGLGRHRQLSQASDRDRRIPDLL